MSRGIGGVHSPSIPQQPPELSFWGTPASLSPPVTPSIVGGDPAPLGCLESRSGAPALPPRHTQTPVLPDVHGLFAVFDTKPAPKKSHKGITRSNSKWQHFTRDGGRRERRVEGKQAASPTAMGHPLSPSPAGRDPLPTSPDTPSQPGDCGGRGVPNPRETPRLGWLVPLCLPVYKYPRGRCLVVAHPSPPSGGDRGASAPPGTPSCLPPLLSLVRFEVGGPPRPPGGSGAGAEGAILTLSFKFANDGVQVGVLGGHMAPAHRHRSAAL